jgi:hypothetical protein
MADNEDSGGSVRLVAVCTISNTESPNVAALQSREAKPKSIAWTVQREFDRLVWFELPSIGQLPEN